MAKIAFGPKRTLSSKDWMWGILFLGSDIQGTRHSTLEMITGTECFKKECKIVSDTKDEFKGVKNKKNLRAWSMRNIFRFEELKVNFWRG